jgi:DUF1009 family protein
MLALICGAGDLPRAIADALPEPPVICALHGFEPEGLVPDIRFRLETLGSLLVWLKARGVDRVCFCGHIRRPDFDPAALDTATKPFVPRFLQALEMGDDGALRIVLELFAEAGFDVLAAQDAAPALLPSAGVPTRAKPALEVASDAALGEATVAQMGALDQGQACVIRAGAVVAREQADGTDAMLRRLSPSADAADAVGMLMDNAGALLGAAADWLSGIDGAGQGILFKAPKPQQDRRADLPVIGPDTVASAARAGLSGIVIEAGGVMVLHRARVIAACDRAGLFLWIRERGA